MDNASPELILLEDEQIYEMVPGVMNLSKDFGQIGTLWVTSLRICWAAQLQENYNCSLPFLQVQPLKSYHAWFCVHWRVPPVDNKHRLGLGGAAQVCQAARDEVWQDPGGRDAPAAAKVPLGVSNQA